jgi:hypothetical protein
MFLCFPRPSIAYQKVPVGTKRRKSEDLIMVCQDLQAEQLNIRFELIVLIVLLLPWRWDLPIDLYPSAPPDTDQG